MAKKRSGTKRRSKSSPKRIDLTLQLLKILGSLTLLILLVVSAGFLTYYFLRQPSRPLPDEVPPVLRKPLPPVKSTTPPAYEVFPENGLPPTRPLTKLQPLPGDNRPLVAIILDDMGYDRQMAAEFLGLDAPLTLSMLPYGPFSRQIMDEAQAKGHEIMLHLPMEPNEFPAVNPGPGALLSDMSPDELIAQLDSDLDQFPGLKGVNNHMGSRISTSPERMRQIFTVLKKRGLFYIDSRTTAETVARPSAQLLQVPFAERDIFIDHVDKPGFIHSQLQRLIKRAQQQGYAVGIAHPHPNTYRELADFLPRLKAKVHLVPASMIISAVNTPDGNQAHARR